MHSTVRQYHIISSYHSNGKEKKTEFALYNSCKKTTYMNEPIDKLPIRCYMLSNTQLFTHINNVVLNTCSVRIVVKSNQS